MSAIAIAVIKFHIQITDTPALGFKFAQPDQRFLYWALFFGILYFLVAYISYSLPDSASRNLLFESATPAFIEELRTNYRKWQAYWQNLDREAPPSGGLRAVLEWHAIYNLKASFLTHGTPLRVLIKSVWYVRIWVFEFWCPIALASYALMCVSWGLNFHHLGGLRAAAVVGTPIVSFLLLFKIGFRLYNQYRSKRTPSPVTALQLDAIIEEMEKYEDTIRREKNVKGGLNIPDENYSADLGYPVELIRQAKRQRKQEQRNFPKSSL